MSEYYILEGKETRQVKDVIEWVRGFDRTQTLVERTEIGEAVVSTVFLGLDHSFMEGRPLLFETMIFGGVEDLYCDRYSTWDEAVEGHKKACDLIKSATV